MLPLEVGVASERSGWRDQDISRRHRAWGFNCPAVDLDFLLIEYNFAKPVAVVEYKHHKAAMPNFTSPTYKALTALADGYTDKDHETVGLPFLVAFYWPDCWAVRVFPINDMARAHFAGKELLCERDFVMRLYKLRRLVASAHLEGRLSTVLPMVRSP